MDVLPRPGRRPLRAPHRLGLAAALAGSKVNHRTLTSAMIDSRDFLAAKRRAENEVLLPAGPEDRLHRRARLQRSSPDLGQARQGPRQASRHGAAARRHRPKGAELIAAKWADNRKVPQIAFKPDWTKHAKAAPFKRNDQMLDVLPIGVMVFPGTGISGQPRRQGQEARHPGLEVRQRRRVSGRSTTRPVYAARRITRCAGRCRFQPPIRSKTMNTPAIRIRHGSAAISPSPVQTNSPSASRRSTG